MKPDYQFWFTFLFGIQTVKTAPNILMITVEDLGWADVSWNNPEVIMPNIATLASDGVILGKFIKPQQILLKYFLFFRFILCSAIKWFISSLTTLWIISIKVEIFSLRIIKKYFMSQDWSTIHNT